MQPDHVREQRSRWRIGSVCLACPTRLCDGAAPLRLDQDIASSVMARRRSSRSVGEGPPSPTLRPVEEVASLAALDLAGLRVQ